MTVLKSHLVAWAEADRASTAPMENGLCPASQGRHTAGALRFSPPERRFLLMTPGIGPLVVERLEQSGIHSIDTLQSKGIDAVVESICQPGHNRAWFNRRRALLRAVGHLGKSAHLDE